MFELRIQTDQASRDCDTGGCPVGVFAHYIQAIEALDANQIRLEGHLTVNREGASRLTFSQVVVDVSADPEVGWLWSTYQPGGVANSNPTVR